MRLHLDDSRPLTSLPSLPHVPSDRSRGWEARAVQRWITANLSSVPSHLLPPVSAIYPSLVEQALLPPPSSLSSELRQSITARAKAEGRARELSTALEEWAPLLHRGFLTKEGRSRAVKRLSQLAQEMREEEGGAQLSEGGKEGGRSAKSARAKHAAVGKEVGKLRGAEEEEGEEGEEGMERGSGDGDGDGKGELEAVEMDSWPPQGWALMDTCGIPNAGLSGPSPYEPFDSS